MNKTALLLIDLQNDYFEDGMMTLVNAAVEYAKLILEKFRMEGFPVIHVQHIAKSPDATFFLPNTIGVEIHKNVQPTAEEKIKAMDVHNSFLAALNSTYAQVIKINDYLSHF